MLFWRKRLAMPTTINLYEAKTNLSDLVERACAGEEIIIAKAGKPKARLMPLEEAKKQPRQFGQNALGITYIAPDFYDDLPLEMFDEPVFPDGMPEEIQDRPAVKTA